MKLTDIGERNRLKRELAEANAALADAKFQLSCVQCVPEHHAYNNVMAERDALRAQLAEANAALLRMEADRDGCLSIMFSSQYGKEIRELQIEVTLLRAQLAEANAARDETQRFLSRLISGEERELNQQAMNLGIKAIEKLHVERDALTAQLSEAQASLAAVQKELANRIHIELDASERARQAAAQLERSPCGHLEDIEAHLEELRDAWERGVISEHDEKGGTRSNRNFAILQLVRKLRAPASQQTTEPLLNISDENNDWNKRAIAANRAERGKEGEQ